ncbi:tRNA uracil 4-sulfurtransferase ThiI [Peptoniphilus indolicus]|nr:tRNA uracil 4-sulfurtransferase ThiI [Peptoniphilus indolicus]SUB74336.1 Probable tRNA sulfurtransferase [Peptoniphilus indolicus]
MEKLISLSLGEVMLKGDNRKTFINKIIGQVKKLTKNFQNVSVYRDFGKIYINCNEEDIDEIIKKVKNIFGIVYITPTWKIDRNMEDFEKAVLAVANDQAEKGYKTFKAKAKRSDKRFETKSADLNLMIGGIVLKNTDYKVDVHNPDFYIYCDVKESIYLYSHRYKGTGGLPIGTNGRGLLLLSGGIDSPVAGYMMAKRGVCVDAVHFHSYPFTSERAEEKVQKLAKILGQYTGTIRMYSCNLLNIQKAINKNCPEDEMTILSRRFMMRIAEEISKKYEYDSIITGENLGQVASQTIGGLNVTNAIPDRVVFRPLIGMDKVDIIEISESIGTYETSIMPFEDCCSVFLPKHPKLRPTRKGIEKSESKLQIEELVQEAMSELEIITIKQED